MKGTKTMKKPIAITDRINDAWLKDPMAELAIELHEEGYLLNQINFDLRNPSHVRCWNYLRDIEINPGWVRGVNGKVYKVKKGN
jgi:hypothetical protein